ATPAYDEGTGFCIGGTLVEPCSCVEGYAPYLARYYVGDGDDVWSLFACCSDSGGAPACGEAALLDVLAPVYLSTGLLGVFICTWLINAKPMVDTLRPEDLMSPVPRNGAEIHDMVGMEKWCVSLGDLQQFRRLVLHAILDGKITPTEADPFDPRDSLKGPTMYTVTEQYIKPVTEAAGGMSWALMKHPEGLECDLFITHGWAEGVFEFMDKVSYSWPKGATAAYVCFLSNPQNLDITHLIATPEQSPFARALRVANQMLVVPNQQVSIYTRIWCVYEAFVAYSLEKPIRTALAPVTKFWPGSLRMFYTTVAFQGLGFLAFKQIPPLQWGMLPAPNILTMAAMITFCWGLFVKAKWPQSKLHLGSIHVGYAFASMGGLSSGYLFGFGSAYSAWGTLWLPFLASALETDRLLAKTASRQSRQLRDGFKGIDGARSSNRADQERILSDIHARGAGRDVDETISVLLDMGHSYPELHAVAKWTGPLGDISTWSRAMILIAFTLGIYVANEAWFARNFISFTCIALEILTFFIAFPFFPPHRKAFAEKSQIVVIVVLLFFLLTNAWERTFSAPYVYAFFLGPLMLSMSAAGPARVAQVPFLGAPVVRALFARNPLRVPKLNPQPSNSTAEVVGKKEAEDEHTVAVVV
ncbi:unnamed protein product, partial [Symbiodinium sp. CCMP2456]